MLGLDKSALARPESPELSVHRVVYLGPIWNFCIKKWSFSWSSYILLWDICC